MKTTAALLLTGALFALAACGGGSHEPVNRAATSPVSPEITTRHYAGPGSRWDVRLNSDFSFSIERRSTADSPVILMVTGTYQELDSGFIQFVVGNAQGEDAPELGQTAWAIEVPGYALFLKPDETPFGGFITMIQGGSCPDTDLTANWLVIRPAISTSADNLSSAHVGQLSYTAATDNVTINQRQSLMRLDTDLGGIDLGSGECSEGMIATDRARIYLTSAGGALVHTNHPDEAEREIIFAMQDVPISSISDLDGDYIGLIHDVDNPSGNNVAPTTMNCSAGLCEGNVHNHLNVLNIAESYSLNLFGSLNLPGPGMTSGQVRTDLNLGALVCQNLSYTTDKVLIFCIAQNPDDPSQQITLMARSR